MSAHDLQRRHDVRARNDVLGCAGIASMEPERTNAADCRMLMCRYPNQILDPVVRAYIYRWPDNPVASKNDYTVRPSCLVVAQQGCFCRCVTDICHVAQLSVSKLSAVASARVPQCVTQTNIVIVLCLDRHPGHRIRHGRGPAAAVAAGHSEAHHHQRLTAGVLAKYVRLPGGCGLLHCRHGMQLAALVLRSSEADWWERLQ